MRTPALRAWAVVVGTLCTVAAALAAHLTPRWEVRTLPVVVGLVLAAVVFFHGMQEHINGYAALVRLAGVVLAGGWATLVAYRGLDLRRTVLLLVTALVFLVTLALMPYEYQPFRLQAPGQGRDSRPKEWLAIEAILCRLLTKPVTVVGMSRWDNPQDGYRVRLLLDANSGMTWKDLHGITDRFAAAIRLPIGCAVRVLDGQHQGEALLDVMSRDCLADEVIVQEPVTPASINDAFEVMSSPRGEELTVCLREQSMVLGGFVGSGKTTVLHRIIFFLARCLDVLIWVIDMNGGGLATPWIEPWATGKASRPVVDWIAHNEEEAAIMVAVGTAIAKDRKTSQAARSRKRAANTTVLPVDSKLPAILILTDEGGEVRQAISLFGRRAAEGITRLAQIGRAEAVRMVLSVLRGTSDILDKGFRTQAAVRLCLQMAEEVDYSHVLGTDPGGARLVHKGSGWLYRTTDLKPVFGRTVNVTLDRIESHAIACQDHRPDLDERATQVAAQVRLKDVLGRDVDRDEAHDLLRLTSMADVQAGRAYAGRWDRYAHVLAEMRGDDPPEVVAEETSQDDLPSAPATSSPALAALLQVGRVTTDTSQNLVGLEDLDERARQLIDELDLPDEGTTRGRIQVVLAEANGDALQPSEIVQAITDKWGKVSRQRVQDLLKQEKTAGKIIQTQAGGYALPD